MPTLRLLAPLLAVAAGALVFAAVMVGRDPGVETGGRGLRLAEVASGFASPVHVAAAPGEPGRLYVVEQAGRIRLVEDGRVRTDPFLDITERVGSRGNEQGLLSVAFHPDYADNGLLYIDYTNLAGDTEIVEYRSDGERALPDSRRVLVEIDDPRPAHNGGQLAFGPDGRLYFAMGDGGGYGDPENRAQNLDEPLGKLQRLDVEGERPEPELVAYGLRNPWRFSFDREAGDLWIGDVGQDGWEEIDVLPAGTSELVNFGWDVREGRHSFEKKAPNRAGTLVDPVAEYPRAEGCSVIGGFVYRGSRIPKLAGRYLFGDHCSGIISSLVLEDGDGKVRREPLVVPELTSFGEDAAGELYLVSRRGTVYRLAP